MSKTEEAACKHALIARWYKLTRDVLPGMAATHLWPIARDHCFMRVCLDAVLGAPWDKAVARPAVHNMSVAQLVAAIGIAESVAAEPSRLAALNARSLEGRRVRRSGP